ncbi:AI-2E family transporter [Miniimonas arenae]|uniref:AI-2E family transporter n=1 Tax=Miniimonas arenae TaxID=676201 RepID=UPI0028AB5FE3|nr:AI-2E family transporter [Miniimonas arenae]
MTSPAPDRSAAPGTGRVARSPLSPTMTVLLGTAAAIIVFAGMSAAREVIGPLALGAVVAIICHPVRHPLERRGWPSWLATTAVIVTAYLVLAALALMLVFAGARFVDLLPEFGDELVGTAQGLQDWLTQAGLDQPASDAIASFLDPGRIAGMVQSLGGTALSVLTSFFFVLAYVIFMAADAARYSHAEHAYGPGARRPLARFGAYTTNVRRYYVVNASFGAVVAILDGIALWLLDVPAAMVWAILAFVTNFVPNIGFVLGLVPPALLALVIGGWPLALAVVAIYCVVNVVLQVLVQPKFVSDAVNLSLTLSFMSVIFWSFVIGPLGAILSIPLTLLVRAVVLEGDPGARWLRWLTGDRDAVEAGGGVGGAKNASGEPSPSGTTSEAHDGEHPLAPSGAVSQGEPPEGAAREGVATAGEPTAKGEPSPSGTREVSG